MPWNYRIVKDGEYFSIREVYYNKKNGKITNVSEEPIVPVGETMEELMKEVENYYDDACKDRDSGEYLDMETLEFDENETGDRSEEEEEVWDYLEDDEEGERKIDLLDGEEDDEELWNYFGERNGK